MDPLIEFPPEFFAMATAFWQTYSPMLIVWVAVVLAVVLLFAFGLAIYYSIKPLLP